MSSKEKNVQCGKLINEVPEATTKKETSKDSESTKIAVRSTPQTAVELQRYKLEKLMKNPNKPVAIEVRKDKDYMQTVPTFIRNVMGSSAGAGSGEFHVYRHLRRREYARQKQILVTSLKEQEDEEYRNKIEENKRKAEEKTSKKRAKRLKKKERAKEKSSKTNKSQTCQISEENQLEAYQSSDEDELETCKSSDEKDLQICNPEV